MGITTPSNTNEAQDAETQGGVLEHWAIAITGWVEKWFPDSYIFALLALVVVVAAALANGTSVNIVAKGVGEGFWGIIPFTMQMTMIIISGYVVAISPPVTKLIDRLVQIPSTARGAITFSALVAILTSPLNWAFSTVFCSLVVRAMARRTDLKFDYRAASAAAYLGLGAVWALGISSSAAQLQANPASLTDVLLKIAGVLPFSQTIFLWQSGVMLACISVASLVVCYLSAPSASRAQSAADLGIELGDSELDLPPATRPGEWLEYSPLLSLIFVGLVGLWLWDKFGGAGFLKTISDLNTYNLIFITLGILLNWRPKRFLAAVARTVPAVSAVLIQFPLYSSIAFLVSKTQGDGGLTLANHLTSFFVENSTHDSFPVMVGIYSAVLGFFVPSGGGKWLIEAPYVLQAAVTLKAHLGWTVQAYNAAEALPNLINPFWMLPMLGILGIKAREVVGFTFLQFLVHTPLVIFLLWLLGMTLDFVPPIQP